MLCEPVLTHVTHACHPHMSVMHVFGCFRFAKRAKQITTSAKVNEQMSAAMLQKTVQVSAFPRHVTHCCYRHCRHAIHILRPRCSSNQILKGQVAGLKKKNNLLRKTIDWMRSDQYTPGAELPAELAAARCVHTCKLSDSTLPTLTTHTLVPSFSLWTPSRALPSM